MISPQPQERGRSTLDWAMLAFGILGAPLAWLFHSLSIVLLVPTACDLGNTLPHWLVTGGAAAVSLVALGVSRMLWKRSAQDEGTQAESQDMTSTADSSRGGFLSWGGVFISIMFLLLILIESIPLAVLGACEPHP